MKHKVTYKDILSGRSNTDDVSDVNTGDVNKGGGVHAIYTNGVVPDSKLVSSGTLTHTDLYKEYHHYSCLADDGQNNT